MPRTDEAFANDIRSALDRGGIRSGWPVLIIIGAIVLAAIVWSRLAVLEESTRGSGRVIPSSQIQVVQPLEGGIVAAIDVAEGDRVEAGQPLMRIDDTSFASQLGEIRNRRDALEVRRVRLAAEVSGATPDFSDDLPAPLVERERALLEARRASLRQELLVADQQLAQKRMEEIETRTRLEETEGTLALLREELDLAEGLRRRGNFPEIELLRLRRQAQTEVREQTVLEAALPRSAAAIAEIEARLESISAAFRARAAEELAGTVADLGVLEETLRAASDKVRRTVLRAPVAGIVNALPVTTVGAVIQPGQSVAEIVPVDDRLLIEAEVRPQDVAFIRPGQEASVKVTAYDYTVYGDLTGRVERIGADTIADPEGRTFYRVILETDETALGSAENPLPIIPGMVVQVDIQTGEKSVFDYLMTPVNRVRAEALRER